MKSLELVAAIRDAVGPDVEIFIEGHGRFSPRTAIQIGKQLEEFNPGWYEEPVPPENVHALKQVHEQVNIPIASGERWFTRYQFPDYLNSGAVDIVQADIIHAGGFLEMKKIAAMADAQYRVMAPHNSNGPVCTAASIHFGFCTTNYKVQEIFDDFVEPWVKEAVPGVPNVVDGYVELPTGPGLGISLNEDLIKEHPYKEGFFNLFANDWQKRQFAK
ncbi:MAG: D-galactonate dehydratase [Candidatus Latescibacteria bacterium ADurb.Bin168]|nr:MAG: D-galactonate dehydratase [Candidatus Latescibacteria bacterium ADurb.Bin168]